MTARVAGFVSSPEGLLWGRYCERYGLNPGHIFSDEVVAFQVGMAYMVRDGVEAKPETTEPLGYWEGQLR